jgi:hypothetical protein
VAKGTEINRKLKSSEITIISNHDLFLSVEKCSISIIVESGLNENKMTTENYRFTSRHAAKHSQKTDSIIPTYSSSILLWCG